MTPKTPYIMVDAHVHLHDHFSLHHLMLTALQNFRRNAHAHPSPGPVFPYLLLTESAGVDGFHRLTESIGTRKADGFRVQSTSEPCSLQVSTYGGQHLFIIAGRQIVTAEGLEILALGHPLPYPDNLPLDTVLDQLAATDCLRVIPWGAGKWLGKRGQLVNALVDNWQGGPLFLGDNGNRPHFWPLPRVFAKAVTKGIGNLPGSDPLPFKGEENKVGSFGFMLPGDVDSERPFQSLRHALFNAQQDISLFGSPERSIPFVKNQVSMQFVKRGRKHHANQC